MKLNLKAIGKGIVAAGTLVGGAILALQAKKGLQEQEFDATLEPLGNDDDLFCEECEKVEAEEIEQEEETEEEVSEEDD